MPWHPVLSAVRVSAAAAAQRHRECEQLHLGLLISTLAEQEPATARKLDLACVNAAAGRVDADGGERLRCC